MHVAPTIQQPTSNVTPCDSNGTNQDVERLLGQLLEENQTNQQSTTAVNTTTTTTGQLPQRTVHTIQLTPQKQQHLKSIQLQIQTLSARLTPGDTEMHNALKLLFQEQQKILASGKLLPPDKVYYHNNQLTIVNPLPVSIPSSKTEQKTSDASLTTQTRLNATTVSQESTTASITFATVNSSQPTSSTITTSQASQLRPKLPTQQVKYLPNFTKAQL